MKVRQIAVSLTAAYFIVSVFAFLSVSCGKKKWNYFVFAQRWPPAACLELRYGKCSIPKGVSDWIVHGLWPTSEKGYPSFCNNSWPFDYQDLKPILPELTVKWANIMSSSSTYVFWKHEWLKHGTCAASVQDVDGTLRYFKQTIVLHDKYNFYEILRKAAVIPDENKVYVLKYIENAIQMQLNKTIKLFCKHHEGYEFPLLDTVYFCMDKQFELIDCNIPSEPSCKSASVIYLPLPNEQKICHAL